MDFFSSIPEPEPRPEFERPAPPEWMVPEDVRPIGLPFNRLLLNNARVAVFLDGLRAYPAGFEFDLHIRWAPGQGRHSNPFRWPGAFGEEGPAEEELRLGVLYADGRRAATDRSLPWNARERRQQPVISASHGSGSDNRIEQRFYVWGLPEEGPVTLVWAWPAEGQQEQTVLLDGDALRAAAGLAEPLWTG
ncbi:hypothetical protein C7C46_31655 [Streptomyces tateyamensis]|uniref:Uncharacterized protein n=1 Tax=Streptomyces tateyamensis TaxID=565073 RepID=A0A2V4N7B7_9ACTN|nr:hypothetical protein [Streptomyces tateyamensis]PYC66055.1 hypothetical protein C7C46_31655 [Streptomyces tateyamensis]